MKNRAAGNEQTIEEEKKTVKAKQYPALLKVHFLKRSINGIQAGHGLQFAMFYNKFQLPFSLHYQNVKLLYKIQLIGTGKV